jgi:exodeoxyribonuclease V alpha subunit
MKKAGNTQNLIKLKGQLERVTYENDENSYVVARVKVYGYRDLVTIIGNIPSPTPGEVLSMLGQWQSHPKFGNQFKVEFCTCSVPATTYGIEKYLGSGLIKGISYRRKPTVPNNTYKADLKYK